MFDELYKWRDVGGSFRLLDPIPRFVYIEGYGVLFLITSNNSQTQADGPRIQINSDTVYWEIASDPAGWGLTLLHKTTSQYPPPPYHHHFRCPSQAQILTYASNQLAEAQRFPRPLPRID